MSGWVANALQIYGLLLIGRKQRIGWLYGIAAEILWLFRAGEKHMPDLMFISAVYIVVAGWNWWQWKYGKQ
jgi:hypothetical protein